MGWLAPVNRGRRSRRPGRVRAGEALAAQLHGGTLAVDGLSVPVHVEGALADLAGRLQAARFPREEAEPSGLTAELRPYQRRGLAWLSAMSELGLGGCLADDMGPGKTIQAIALHLLRRRGPLLVVCPASLRGNWERELRRFAPDLPVRRYHGGSRHLADVACDEVVLATYGMVLRDRKALAEVAWDIAVADEAQYVKNPLSRSARELRSIPAAVRVALTGTPVENRLSDLWSIVDEGDSTLVFKLARSITEHRAGIEAALVHDLSNARVESMNTRLRLLTRIAFGFRSPDALIAHAMLSLGGYCPPLPGRS